MGAKVKRQVTAEKRGGSGRRTAAHKEGAKRKVVFGKRNNHLRKGTGRRTRRKFCDQAIARGGGGGKSCRDLLPIRNMTRGNWELVLRKRENKDVSGRSHPHMI